MITVRNNHPSQNAASPLVPPKDFEMILGGLHGTGDNRDDSIEIGDDDYAAKIVRNV